MPFFGILYSTHRSNKNLYFYRNPLLLLSFLPSERITKKSKFMEIPLVWKKKNLMEMSRKISDIEGSFIKILDKLYYQLKILERGLGFRV